MSALFSLTEFYKFCNSLKIDTKEQGKINLGHSFMKSQRRLINEIGAGLENGVHEFVTLKARQLGISTASLALDLYWAGKYSGISGALITQDQPSIEQFRTTLEMYYQSLPTGLKRRIRSHNRNQLVFQHGTRFLYKVAGVKVKAAGTLGRSASLSFLHATEVAFWGNENDVKSLVSTMAQHNPTRFYHWETTANGFNHFYNMWMEAKNSVTKRAIFIGWWANDFYRAERNTDVFKMYWGVSGRLTTEERTMVQEVKQLYDVDITVEQMAWYRWYLREKVSGDLLSMWQEMPHTEYAAFVATGSNFFKGTSVGEAYRWALAQPEPRYYRFHTGMEFTDTEIIEVDSKTATLKIWEEPVQGAQYALGADPAYGSSPESNRYAINVFRCYANKLIQVAEFKKVEMTSAEFAWVMVYLAASYGECIWNLEINGPGQAVLTELFNLTKQRTIGTAALRGPLNAAMSKIRTYLYRRYDSVYSVPSSIHTLTSSREKERYLGAFKDYFERQYIIIRSTELIDEMKNLARQDGAAPAATGRGNDDLVIAAALGVIAWNDQLRSKMITQHQTYEAAAARNPLAVPNEVGSRLVQNMMQRIGFTETIKTTKMLGSGGYVPHR